MTQRFRVFRNSLPEPGTVISCARIEDADLSTALFLTQPQVNATRGDGGTVLPAVLVAPSRWHPC